MTKTPMIATAIGMGLFCMTAQAQYTARSVTPKVPSVTTASGSGGFLQGSDNCTTATNLPAGPSTGNPFTTGTTGTTGQNEANCYAFGFFGIDVDVWFRWTDNTTSAPKNVVITTCNGTGVDTKIAVYKLASGCPADGTSVACNDDACGLQSTVAFTAANSPNTYTIQLGTFPGAAGGSGTFDIQVLPATACGQDDDGTTENALGLVAGGEMGWLQGYDCGLSQYTHVDTAYGTAMFPGSVTNGANSKIAGWSAPAGTLDPNALGAPDYVVHTTVVNGDTDILNKIYVGAQTRPASNVTWIMASADHIAGQFPGPMDQTVPVANSWIVGSTLGPGTLDVNQLSNNNVPPVNMAAIGFPANWLIRARARAQPDCFDACNACWVDCLGPSTPDCESGSTACTTCASCTTVPTCFGDGFGASCACGNESTPGSGGGCANGAPMPAGQGAVLSASGTTSVVADDLVLTADFTTNQPGLFFQGNNAVGGGTGGTFGDGIRCCGTNVIRLEIVDPPGPAGPSTASTSQPILGTSPLGTTTPGDTRCYQWWYRNPGTSLCGFNFNLSNAVLVTWAP